jgi:hypothetical protein
MKTLFKRARGAVRWVRPYATFVIGGLFFVVGTEYWWNADDMKFGPTFVMWALGLLIIGRANVLYRQQRS